MILILKDKSQFLCSDALIKESSLLTEMVTYCGNHRDLITVPEFVSRNVLSTITKMLENSPPSLEELLDMTVNKLITLIRVTDFLIIDSLTEVTTRQVLEKINVKNCFDVYKRSKNFPFLNNISMFSLKVLMSNINYYYESNRFTEEIPDPYFINYREFSLNELKMMLSTHGKESSVAKIMIIKHWCRFSLDVNHKEELLVLLDNINADAQYIPKKTIIYMRFIRDKIKKKT